MLKNKESNPLAVFNMQRMEFCPLHFQQLVFPLKTVEKDILDWIYENTEGRFFLSDEINGTGCVAFEIHSEATYFAIFLPQINIPREYL